MNLKTTTEKEVLLAFVHGRFLTNLRNMCLKEPNVTPLAGNVIEVMKTKLVKLLVLELMFQMAEVSVFKAHITFVVDGVFSKYRRELASDFKTSAGSSFVGMSLFNADVPAKYNGNVIFEY